jgi:hypothetical protein
MMAAPTRADRQTTIRLPSVYYDALATAAELADTSVGEEIRRRLIETFGPISERHLDKKTRELLDVTAVMAGEVEEFLPPWHEDPGSYLIFVTALTQWLKQYEPEGAAALKPKPTAERLFGRRPLTTENMAMLLLHAAHSYVAGPPEDGQEEEDR